VEGLSGIRVRDAMNEYSVFFNGISWTCEIEDEEDNVIDWFTGKAPVEALENALKNNSAE
jgi:hypothetical protein